MNHKHEKFFSDLLNQKPDFSEAVVNAGLEAHDVPVRRDESTLTDAEQARFVEVVRQMMQDGSYQRLAVIHANMRHNMHGQGNNRLGLNRFLSWHRRYLLAFEQELQRTDRQLSGQDTSALTVPYWRWSENRQFPTWLEGLRPAFGHDGPGSPAVPREPGPSTDLPTSADVQAIINDFDNRSGLGADMRTYEKFTYCLEGWAQDLPAHNHVHSWVGGVMNNTMYSPADPIFWLHHCEIDRIWWIWQQDHGNDHPPYNRRRLQLDPWTESNYYTVLDIDAIGYGYDVVEP